MAKETRAKVAEGLPRLGGYELIGKVGKGGMGNVFKARQVSMDRIVALKVLTSSLAKDKKFVERFHREAKAAAKLSHMNIIQSIDVGEEDGYHYFAMEYVQGPTVDDLLQKVKALKDDFCLDIICQIARAIQAAEKLGIVHFDIKPSNIMITRERVAKLADFGLARRVAEGATRAKQGLVFGTPEYMSPEQALGKPDVDSRSDIYSLGVSFYQMVTGQLPFAGKTPRETVDLRLTSNPIPPRQLNPTLSDATCQIIDKMLKRDRDQRYQTASELIEDLEYVIKQRSGSMEAQAAAGIQIDIPPEELQAVEQFRYVPRRRRKVMGPLFGFLCLVGVGGGIFWFVKNPEKAKDLFNQLQKKLNIQIGAPQPAPQPIAPVAPAPQAPTFVPSDLGGAKKGADGMPVASSAHKKKGRTDPKAQQSYREIMDMRKYKLSQNDYKGVIGLYKLYPENYKFAIEWEELQEQQKKDMGAAKKWFDTQNALLGNLVAAEKLVEARDLMAKIEEKVPDEILKEAEFEKKKAQIETAIVKAEKGEKAKREAALQGYREAAMPAYKLALQGRYDEALKKIDEIGQDPAAATVQDVVKIDKEDVERLKPYLGSLYAGGKALSGKKFKVGGIGGTLQQVEDCALHIEMGGKAMTKPLSSLKPDELNQLAKAGGFTKDQDLGQLHVAASIFYYFSGDMGNATVELLAAQEEGIKIDRYKDRLKK